MNGKRPTISILTPGHRRLIRLLAAQAAADWLARQSNPITEQLDASSDLRTLQQRQTGGDLDR